VALWKKLALKPGGELTILDAPPDFSVGELPEGATVTPGAPATVQAHAQGEIVLAFFSRMTSLRGALPALGERIFPDGALWTAWPRRAAGQESDISERDIRALALSLGLVDVKVAAIEENWSGLRLVWRREHRHAQGAPRE
jgi:hypothetical protein